MHITKICRIFALSIIVVFFNHLIMNRLFNFIALFVGSIMALSAQNPSSQPLAGFWRMSSDKMETGTLLKVIPTENCAFTASFTKDMQIHYLTGMLYDEKYVSLVENIETAKNLVYTGALFADGSIKGKYYSPDCEHGNFSWIKVCDELGQPLVIEGEEVLPCVAQQNQSRGMATETKMVMTKKVVKVVDRKEYVGEPRNENLPLVETSAYIPEGAIFAGNIDLEEKVTYRTVEIEVPVPQPVVCLPKDTVVMERGVLTTKKFTVCDPGTTNPTGIRGVVIPGKKVVENGITYHIVGQGETMFSIAKRYKITVLELAELNGKDCEHLIANERLRVSK